MAGIAGIVFSKALIDNNSTLLNSMLEIQKHRGQDRDTYVHNKIQMGICGSTVASNADHTITIVLDGVIYNRNEVWKELYLSEAKQQISSPDIIVKAYEAWGNTFLEKIDGDFAFALFDKTKNKLILGRDRLGKKPLYWFHHHHHFIFASELKALLITGIVPQTPASDAVAAYLTMGYIPQDMSPIENVNKLLPGHYLTFDLNHTKSIHSYWSYSSFFTKPINDSPAQATEKLDHLMQTAIKKRIPQNQKLGCFLSGGLGSATIAHYLRKEVGNNDINGFFVRLKGQDSNDNDAVATIAQTLQIPFQEDSITSNDFLDNLIPILWHLDEPLADLHIATTWRLAKMASEKTQTIFSGMGSDELFAGHHRYELTHTTTDMKRKLIDTSQPFIRKVILPLLNRVWPNGAFQLLREIQTNPWQAEYLKQNAIFNEEDIAVAAPHLFGLFDSRVFLNKFHNLSNINSVVSSFIYFDVKTRLADCYASQYDRLTTANSIEWCVPFFDKSIVEYLAGLQFLDKQKAKERHLFLKTILKDTYPAWITQRAKKEHKDHLKQWMLSKDLDVLFKKLLKGILVETGVISSEWITDQLIKYQNDRNAFMQLWTVFTLEIWFRLFIHQPIKSEIPKISLHELLELG